MARAVGLQGQDLMQMLRDTITLMVRSDQGVRDLTSRQLAIFLEAYTEKDGTLTVRGLAESLGVTKPVITRALDRLTELGYVYREVDLRDRRSILVKRTMAGAGYFRTIGDILKQAAKQGGARKGMVADDKVDDREVNKVSDSHRGEEGYKKRKKKK